MTGLNDDWRFGDASGDHALTLSLPFDSVSALHAAGHIPDPYEGRNEYECRWIADRDWVLSREVEIPEGAHELVCEGLDGVVEVALNGVKLALCDNAFRTWRIPLDGAVPGTNRLELHFLSLTRVGAERQAAQPWPVPWHAENCPIPNGNMIRKPQCDFGWDWNIALAPFGVTGGIRLERAADWRPRALHITQEHGEEGVVGLVLRLRCDGAAEGQVARFEVDGQSFEAEVQGGVAHGRVSIYEPRLWWPAGQGRQEFYEVTARIGDHVLTRRIGLRQMELVSEPDAAGRSFGIRVNGRPVFCKGANWIPADALSSRITRQGVRDLLQSAVDANMNMIRVWGGGRYEPGWFYDICDELGLMVWQDFMFACQHYPCDEHFLANVEAEVVENVERIHHHACLALWCGDNELIGALTWFPESRENRDRYLVAYDRLNRTIETALRRADPAANWWPSSPSPGPLDFGDTWHDDTKGDMHFWSVWHEGRDFDHYRDVSPRFCSEFGFQSYPSMEVIRRFAAPEDHNIAAPVMESHQKNAGGNARIAETMFRYYRFPVDFGAFVWLSQVQQAEAIKTAVTAWRALKPHCQGTLYWQLNDTWPVASWASLDHGGGWKVMHHIARAFYAPVFVAAIPDGDAIRLVGISDRPEEVTLDITAYATRLTGEAREIARGSARLGEAAETVLTIAPGTLAADEVLTYGWEGSDGTHAGDIFAPRRWKAYDLPDPGLAHEVSREGDAFRLAVTAQAMAFFVTAEADIPGRWDRNAVHLGPGVTSHLTFTPQDPGATPEFRLRDLHSATYGGAA